MVKLHWLYFLFPFFFFWGINFKSGTENGYRETLIFEGRKRNSDSPDKKGKKSYFGNRKYCNGSKNSELLSLAYDIEF